jgi:hypothetical protein
MNDKFDPATYKRVASQNNHIRSADVAKIAEVAKIVLAGHATWARDCDEAVQRDMAACCNEAQACCDRKLQEKQGRLGRRRRR